MAKFNSRKNDKNEIDDNAKTMSTSTDHDKRACKFQIDRCKTVWGVAQTRYPPFVVECLRRKRGKENPDGIT